MAQEERRFAAGVAPNLLPGLRERKGRFDAQPLAFPVALTMDEAEETIRILWEFVGHMGDDVGIDGYEFRLLERARHWAHQIQLGVLTSIATNGAHLLTEAETSEGIDLTRTRAHPGDASETNPS